MSSDELDVWKEFYAISPFGDDRLELETSKICSVIANVQGNKTSIEDFILFGKKEDDYDFNHDEKVKIAQNVILSIMKI
ncbi:MAG: DUF4035 domain-containing protein [Sulfuricurvum sp.]